jgi:hypothetical protein
LAPLVEVIGDLVHQMLELLITMNGGDAKAGLVVDAEGLVHGVEKLVNQYEARIWFNQ